MRPAHQGGARRRARSAGRTSRRRGSCTRSTGCSRDVVASQLGQQLSARRRARDKQRADGPGPARHGLDAVTYGDTTLQPGASNQLTYAADSTFAVKFTNGGDNDEFNVKVTVKIEGGSGDPITLSDTIDQIAPKASATANLALEQSPPLGAAVTITVKVAPVPGEEKTDNNQAEYQAHLRRGLTGPLGRGARS